MTEREIGPNWDRVEGVSFIRKEGLELIRTKRVAMVGVGSLGSEITRLLCMAGVEKFTFIDPDKLEASNIVRHWAGLTELGNYKVAATKRLLTTEKNPKADVWAVAGDARSQPVLLANCDLAIISGLGSNDSQSSIAEDLREHGIQTLTAGVYQEGLGGEVFLVNPDSGPCYYCFSDFLHRTVSEEVREKKQDYGLEVGQLVAVPALAIDVNRVATIAADYALRTLLGKPFDEDYPSVNLIIFANRKIRIKLGNSPSDEYTLLDPLESRWVSVAKVQDCLNCSVKEDNVNFSYDDLSKILKGGE